MRVMLTGELGSGKSALCRKLSKKLIAEGYQVGGIITESTKRGQESTLHLHDLNNDTHAVLARTNGNFKGPKHGAYTYSEEGIFLGIKAIGRGLTADLLILDEIGPLEIKGKGFFPVLHVLRKAKQCLVVVHPLLVDAILDVLNLETLFEVRTLAPDNHDRLLEELYQSFLADYSS